MAYFNLDMIKKYGIMSPEVIGGFFMKKFLLCVLCVFALTACNRDEETPVLHCGGYDVQTSFSDNGETLHANINGDDVDLSLVVSASGAKYTGILNDTVVVLWSKGDEWTLMLDEEQIIDCGTK